MQVEKPQCKVLLDVEEAKFLRELLIYIIGSESPHIIFAGMTRMDRPVTFLEKLADALHDGIG